MYFSFILFRQQHDVGGEIIRSLQRNSYTRRLVTVGVGRYFEEIFKVRIVFPRKKKTVRIILKITRTLQFCLQLKNVQTRYKIWPRIFYHVLNSER